MVAFVKKKRYYEKDYNYSLVKPQQSIRHCVQVATMLLQKNLVL